MYAESAYWKQNVASFFCRVPGLIGDAVSNKALFFITYIMVDGWAGTASEILRFKPLVIYHLKTETDRENAMDPGSFGFPETVPQLMLYFLFGLMYSVIAPILLPFIIIFFAFAYLVYRHQVRAKITSSPVIWL